MKLNISMTPKTYFIAAAAVFVVGVGLCYMTNSSNGEQQKNLDVLRKDLRDEKEVQEELDESIKKVEEISRKLAHLEKGVPSFAYNATLLKELERFGLSNKVKILQVKPVLAAPSAKKEGDRKKPFEELDIAVKVRGTYDDALRFINGLKNFPKVIAIRTLTMTPHIEQNQDDRAIPSLDVDLEVRAFLFKNEMKATKSAEDEKSNQTASKPMGGAKHES